MADDFFTLAEIQAINDAALSDIQVSALFDDAPVLQRLAAVTASNGDTHKYLEYTGAPAVGARAANAGRDHDRSEDTVRTVTCKILDASFTIDQALTKIWRGGAQALLDREAMRHLRAGMFWVEKQLFNGATDGDASGFAGFADLMADLSNANIVGAGGSTALTSVYLLRTNPDEVAVCAGYDGVIEVGEATIQRVLDGDSKPFPAYMVPITAWYALQAGSYLTSAVRIANIDAGSNTVTDDLIYQGLELFPAGRQPNLIVMNRRSLEQLRNSRTATNGLGTPAPRPIDVEGIPIVVTDGIISTETAVADV